MDIKCGELNSHSSRTNLRKEFNSSLTLCHFELNMVQDVIVHLTVPFFSLLQTSSSALLDSESIQTSDS